MFQRWFAAFGGESPDEALPSLRQVIWFDPTSPLHPPVLHRALS
jgi:hypothetical protein